MRIGDQADDISSCQGSTLDAWEWDENCYHEDDSLAEEARKYSPHQSWLPDSLQELDLETELLASSKEISHYTDRDSFSTQREASYGSEDIVLTCET